MIACNFELLLDIDQKNIMANQIKCKEGVVPAIIPGVCIPFKCVMLLTTSNLLEDLNDNPLHYDK